jgi:predicted nuclease of predicted toxin-antitoxin system
MKFLVDAHLPPSLCALLVQRGHDASHTLDLPAKNATKDTVLNQISLDEQRVIISKDSDFFYSHLVLGQPWSWSWSRPETCPRKIYVRFSNVIWLK